MEPHESSAMLLRPRKSARSWTLTGKISPAENRFELIHERGKVVLELRFLGDRQAVAGRVISALAGFESETGHNSFPIRDLPSLLIHAAQVLGECIGQGKGTEQKASTAG